MIILHKNATPPQAMVSEITTKVNQHLFDKVQTKILQRELNNFSINCTTAALNSNRFSRCVTCPPLSTCLTLVESPWLDLDTAESMIQVPLVGREILHPDFSHFLQL